MKRFSLVNLPKDVFDKVHDINFYYDECRLKGEAWLEDGWVFEYDGSHYINFESRDDLINEVRNFTIDEQEYNKKR